MDELDHALRVLQEFDTREIQRRGFHFQRNDYYSALNDLKFLDAHRDLWHRKSGPLDIDWNLPGQMDVARRVAAFVGELREVPQRSPGEPVQYCWQNDFWNNADALVQYGIVRDRKPGRYVEVGCGWSSLLLRKALDRNETRCEVTLVEPYPNRAIFDVLPEDWVHQQCILQRAPLELFERLGPGDVLFYDGSHCAKVANDVNHFFFEVLPRLASGVLIHLHDIFMPDEYPEEWIFARGQTWNEQYVLQAFLMNNARYRVLIANSYLFHHRGAELEVLYQGIQPASGVSFWLEKV